MPTKFTKPESVGDGAEQVQSAFDEAHAKGYFGEVPDPNPNRAYSVLSGPDSPSVNPTATNPTATEEPTDA